MIYNLWEMVFFEYIVLNKYCVLWNILSLYLSFVEMYGCCLGIKNILFFVYFISFKKSNFFYNDLNGYFFWNKIVNVGVEFLS